MKAIDILNTVLTHTVDAPYTVDVVEPISDSTVVIAGHYRIDEGLIQDQLCVGLRTYFHIKRVSTSINPTDDGWLTYDATLTRKPAFARVPLSVTQ